MQGNVGWTSSPPAASACRLMAIVIALSSVAAGMEMAAERPAARRHVVSPAQSTSSATDLPWPTAIAGYVQLDAAMDNMVASPGGTVRIKCEITGNPLPRYVWYKDDVAVDSTGGDSTRETRFNIKTTPWGSRLKIVDLESNDSGSYRCEGYNQFGHQWTNGTLLVRLGSNPSRPRQPMATPYDTEVKIDDIIDRSDLDFGSPLFHGLPGRRQHGPSYNTRNNDDLMLSGNTHVVDIYDDDYDVEEDIVDGRCELYSGLICFKYIADRAVFVRSSVQQSDMESRLKDQSRSSTFNPVSSFDECTPCPEKEALKEMSSIGRQVSPECSKYAVPALCYAAFPPCADQQADVGHATGRRPLGICRDDCEQLINVACKAEYDFALRTTMRVEHLQSLLPNCQRMTNDRTKCVKIDDQTEIPTDDDHLCYNETGSGYIGTVSITVSGKSCLRWSLVTTTLSASLRFHSLLGDHNYCRNPDNRLPAPWCFTDADSLAEEICDVRSCRIRDNSPDVSTLRYVIFPCMSLLVVAILVFIAVCICRHRRRRHFSDGKSPYTRTDARGAPVRRHGNGAAASASEFPIEFPVSSVQLTRDVCEDHRFRGSRVYLGQLAHVQPPCRPVLVRMLCVDADERTRSEFWRDVDALHVLRHPHVAAVVGVTGRTVVSAPASMLLECGPDLLNLHQYVIYAGNDPKSLDHAARLRFAIQIAAGMDYLSSRGIVHGDLASRNVMMISTPGSTGLALVVAKINVGLSLGPALFPGDYQTVRPDCPPLPVRWMSPEAIATGGRSLTTPGDVWSYGVTLWELYSAGCRPYEGFDDHEIAQLILARQLLPCPPPPVQTGVVTSRVYGLMVDCWAVEPGDRPTFADVMARLEQWQTMDAAVTAGRRHDASSRSNSTRSNSDAVSPRRSSPFAAISTRASRTNEDHNSTVAAPDGFKRPSDSPVKDIPQRPPPELVVDGKLTSRGVSGMSQSSHHGRHLANNHCTTTASNSPEHHHNDIQLLPQSTDAMSLHTVDVL